jgi:hypothetical protein
MLLNSRSVTRKLTPLPPVSRSGLAIGDICAAKTFMSSLQSGQFRLTIPNNDSGTNQEGWKHEALSDCGYDVHPDRPPFKFPLGRMIAVTKHL